MHGPQPITRLSVYVGSGIRFSAGARQSDDLCAKAR